MLDNNRLEGRFSAGLGPKTKMLLVREADRVRIAQRFIAGVQ